MEPAWRPRRSRSAITNLKPGRARTAHQPTRLRPPLTPMEAVSVDQIPSGLGWQYEPKWDGFRCLVFRDHDSVVLQAKSGKPLTRYFPELVEAFSALEPRSFVLDGEIVVPSGKTLSFDELLQRIHPAQTRIKRLAAETPARFIAFDLLEEGGRELMEQPLSGRREALDAFAEREFGDAPLIALSPATTSLAVGKRWFKLSGGALDGIIVKRRDAPYRPGSRDAMVKVKQMRTADCVVGGFRYAEVKSVVGSLLLGLYDDDGLLHHVGFTSAIKADERGPLARKLERLKGSSRFTGSAPGGPSRWSTARSTRWVPVTPKLVVEVSYDHFSGERFRHGTRLLRWRPDKAPQQCTMEQVKIPHGNVLKLLEAKRT
jgi:ATP-dependent DNA ligase